jgi:uncharacterized integral membrane protein
MSAVGGNPVQYANDSPPQGASGPRKYANYITCIVLLVLAIATVASLCISTATVGAFAVVFITPLALGALYETLIGLAIAIMIVAAFVSGYFLRRTVSYVGCSIPC